jgi:hypothetical protein
MQEPHGRPSLRPDTVSRRPSSPGWLSFIGLPTDLVRGRAEEKTTQPFPVPFSLQPSLPKHVLPVQRMSELLPIPFAAPLLSLGTAASELSLPLLSWRSWTRRCVPVRTFCETVGRYVCVVCRWIQSSQSDSQKKRVPSLLLPLPWILERVPFFTPFSATLCAAEYWLDRQESLLERSLFFFFNHHVVYNLCLHRICNHRKKIEQNIVLSSTNPVGC